MKLQSVTITNFRCIDDSGEFSIAPTTCLVGKNESGKTTILQALERLNPYDVTKATYDKVQDYPRKFLSDYDERHAAGKAQVLNTEWALEPADIEVLTAEFGGDAVTADTAVHISKGYGDTSQWWAIGMDVPKALLGVASMLNLAPDETAVVAGHTGSETQLLELIASRGTPATPGLQSLQAKLATFPNSSVRERAVQLLEPRLPKFLYFSSYDRMSGKVQVEKLTQDVAKPPPGIGVVSSGDSVFLDFLAFAGTSLPELASVKKFEDLKAHVEAASIKISRQIFEYWSQNRHLKVEFSLESGRSEDPAPFNTGNVMHARIRNQLHDMTVPFDDRSAGFTWFFSFLVKFSQVKKHHGNVIILLDEPGLNLHAMAQADFLRYIKEKLEPGHQVVYTTHSPFMVPPDNLSSVRTVEDVVIYKDKGEFETRGTKVGDRVLSTDRDTLFPLQGALGYEITQSLFVGPHTLLVEGPSDLLYLQAISAHLKAAGRTGLDKRWTVCPTGGVDKVSAFISLFGGNKLHVAVLTDYASGQKKKVEQLLQSKLLQDGHVFLASELAGQAEGDIEDVLGAALYSEIVNRAYTLKALDAITPAKVAKATTASPRLVLKIEELFRLLPKAAEFDHFTPANWLIQNPQLLNEQAAAAAPALDRCEGLFKALNGLL